MSGAVIGQAEAAEYEEDDIRRLVDVVAAYEGVPADVLYAMALAESGQRIRGNTVPWPWSLNVVGEPRRFDTRDAMFEDLMAILGEGHLRVDIGLMQINWYWQFERLSSPWRITEPAHNLKVAAQILADQYQIHGSWREAVGLYHRPAEGDEHRAAAARYQERVYRFLDSFAKSDSADSPSNLDACGVFHRCGDSDA